MTPSQIRRLPEAPAFRVTTANTIDKIARTGKIPATIVREVKVVAAVLPFCVNQYVLDNLIDWAQVPDDPIFRLTFPTREMLHPDQYTRVAAAIDSADQSKLTTTVNSVRRELNPDPGLQQLNTPWLDGQRLEGLQHKYANTLLVFPHHGQTCHTYCVFCFRWSQLVNDGEQRMATSGPGPMVRYLERHPEVTDVLLTGGDPMVMSARRLSEYLLPLMHSRLGHIDSIRIGTKALSFWPQRFVDDHDSDDFLRLIERLTNAQKHVTIMAHYDHWCELEAPIAREAVRRIRNAGAVIRSQGPLLRGINDSSDTVARLWTSQVRLGIVPYYLFVARDTGARRCFEVTIDRSLQIYRDALSSVSGLARSARGPVMSTGSGKILVQGEAEIGGQRVFVLSFLQARREDWVSRTFFAKHDRSSCWFSQLSPIDESFFFESDYRRITDHTREVDT